MEGPYVRYARQGVKPITPPASTNLTPRHIPEAYRDLFQAPPPTGSRLAHRTATSKNVTIVWRVLAVDPTKAIRRTSWRGLVEEVLEATTTSKAGKEEVCFGDGGMEPNFCRRRLCWFPLTSKGHNLFGCATSTGTRTCNQRDVLQRYSLSIWSDCCERVHL